MQLRSLIFIVFKSPGNQRKSLFLAQSQAETSEEDVNQINSKEEELLSTLTL